MNFKISTRLLILGGMMSALACVLVFIGLFGMYSSNQSLKSVYSNSTVPVAQMAEIEVKILENRLAISSALSDHNKLGSEALQNSINANLAAIDKTWNQFTATDLTEDEKKLSKTFADNYRIFVQQGLEPALAALQTGNHEDAQKILDERIAPLYTLVHDNIKALTQQQVYAAQKAFADADDMYNQIIAGCVVIFLLGMAASGLYNFLLIRALGRELGTEPAQAAKIARNVADGNLAFPIRLKAGDSYSLLSQLQLMQHSLTRVVSNVRQNSERLAVACAEISQGNNDLSGRTENQASALQQTAASMEELGSTVKQNAASANEANQLALSASNVAVKGGEVVAEVVETMRGINESSRKISDIISVIDGIAFQTNILALNAAVEAARAGEQGRGFAVVASEVRSLAGRSADAAKEIKLLINASVERVEQGTQLVDQAGSTMTEVVTSIRRLTDIMGAISSASNEQSLGVAEVGEAIKQMDEVTQQNAALVEEMAAAASSLKSQAEELVHTVAVFKLNQDNANQGSVKPVAPVAKTKRLA